MFQKRVMFLAAVSFSMGAVHAAAPGERFDILGLRTGMSEQEVSAAVKQEIPNAIRTTTAKYQAEGGMKESIASVTYCFGDVISRTQKEVHNNNTVVTYRGCGSKTLTIDFTRLQAQAFKIERRETYNAMQQVSTVAMDKLAAAIKAKYGDAPADPGGYKPANQITGRWLFDVQGAPSANARCALEVMDVTKPAYRPYQAGCGYQFTYTAATTLENAGLAANLSMSSIDFNLVNGDYKNLMSAMGQNEKNRQEQQIRNAGSTPKM